MLRRIIAKFFVLCFRTSMGLAGIAKSLLGVAMVKDTEIRCGNWEAEELTEPQVGAC